MVWAMLLSRWARPGQIAGALALSGRLFPDLLAPGTPLHARLADPQQLAGMPILATHGAQDFITPVDIGRENERALSGWAPQADLVYLEDPDCGHEISPVVAAAVSRWFEEHVTATE